MLPITSMRLDHDAPPQRISTGIAGLDQMLGGKGLYRGSSVLVSGSPGTGKSSVGVAVAAAACARGERAMLFCYEESAAQVLRNMRSIGIDLQPWVEQGLLRIHASRPTLHGVEQHLVQLHDLVVEFEPALVVVDPISNLTMERDDTSLKPMLMRLIDFLKHRRISGVFTSLTSESAQGQADSQVGVSSLMDTWLVLANLESNGERTRSLQVVKSRGMPHSNQVREFVISDDGLSLIDVFRRDSHVLTGSARIGRAKQEAERGAAAGNGGAQR